MSVETFENMNFLSALFDTFINFVRRNPLLVLLIVILAVTAPSLLRGIASVVLYLVGGFILFIILLVVWARWKIYKMQKQMRDQFGGGAQQRPHGGFYTFYGPGAGRTQSGRQRTERQPDEGEVKVHKTASTPEKRISNRVGDYVDFEETQD